MDRRQFLQSLHKTNFCYVEVLKLQQIIKKKIDDEKERKKTI